MERNIEPLFASVVESLEASAGNFIHPTYGIGAGLNCKLIGEDMDILANNLCNLFLPKLYIMLIIFGCLSFAILISLCFLTCSVSRHFDQWLKKEGNQEVQSGSDEAPAKSQPAKSRIPTAFSSRDILSERDKELNDNKVLNSNGSDDTKKLDLRQTFKPAHRRDRYKKRGV